MIIFAVDTIPTRYLTDYPAWSKCTEPANVVEWNIILLSILIALSGLQLIICILKVATELKRTLCGTYSVFVQAGILWKWQGNCCCFSPIPRKRENLSIIHSGRFECYKEKWYPWLKSLSVKLLYFGWSLFELSDIYIFLHLSCCAWQGHLIFLPSNLLWQ